MCVEPDLEKRRSLATRRARLYWSVGEVCGRNMCARFTVGEGAAACSTPERCRWREGKARVLGSFAAPKVPAKEASVSGSVSKVEMATLHCPSKGMPAHKQAHDNVVHLSRFSKADGLTHQAFDVCPYSEMRARDFLGVVCAGSMLFRVEVTRIRALMICRVVREPTGLQQRLELEEDSVFATTKDSPLNPLPCHGHWPVRASVGCLCSRQTTTAHPSQLRRLAQWLL